MNENYKACEVCGRKVKTVKLSKTFNKLLCEPHNRQLKKFGKIIRKEVGTRGKRFFKNENEFIKKQNFYILKALNKKLGNFDVKIDLEDYEKCVKYCWYINLDKTIIAHDSQNKKTLHLHRFVMGNPKNYMVKRINTKELDFRKSNLKLIPMNKPDLDSSKGISWNSNHLKWQVNFFAGRYSDLKEAEKIRDYLQKHFDKIN